MYLAFPFIGLRWIDREMKEPDSLLEALHSGTLVLTEHDVHDAIAIDDIEYVAGLYLLDIGGGKTLVLNGQCCKELVEKGLFPSSKIRIFWDKVSLETYGVEPIGTKILISKRLDEVSSYFDSKGNQLNDRDIINQSISDVVSAMENNA